MFCWWRESPGTEGSVQGGTVRPERSPWAEEDSGPVSYSPMQRDPGWLLLPSVPITSPTLLGVFGVPWYSPWRDGWARPCCNTHRGKEIKGPQLPDTLEIALLFSHSACWKAGDFCADFLTLQGEKKIESFWALLHNSFTQTFSSTRFRVRNAAGLHLTYMEGPPGLHPCSVIYFF